MKFAVLVGDGMGDYPREDLGGRTVLEAAYTPNMDRIASLGKGGLARTIPESMHPGSDVANMELLGHDTTRTFAGRGVFEALSMGLALGKDDVAFRMNFVTLENGRMEDYSAEHISTEEAQELVNLLETELGKANVRFFPGVSYRNLMVWSGGSDKAITTPPHDILGQGYSQYLPRGEGSDFLNHLMQRASDILKEALLNKKREASGKAPANAIWLWGQGKKLGLPSMTERYGLSGGVISAVDLIKGIGIASGLEPVFVPGATGYLDTNFRGKGLAAVESLKRLDFMYVHVEAPDEAGHRGEPSLKIKAIEDFDRDVVGTVLEEAAQREDMAVLVVCDHMTPLEKRTHTREPVPFAFWGAGMEPDEMNVYSEIGALKGSYGIIEGNTLLNKFIGEFHT